MTLIVNRYGKARVRIMRVHRADGQDELRELTVQAMLEGDFDRAYTCADNRAVVATDTIKNIVNIVARENVAASAEMFCQKLAERFLDRYDQICRVLVETAETRWTRLAVGGVPHAHGFVLDANGKPTVRFERSRAGQQIRSGIAGFTFMKSTGSGWTDYVRDEYTTLAETTNRIAATSMTANWLWASLPADPGAANAAILGAMLEVFAGSYSHGMQDSLYRMGEAALAAVQEITEIAIACPNKHYLPIDLRPFGMASDNMIFTPTDEPHGQIECTLART
jgi:urate oxidase